MRPRPMVGPATAAALDGHAEHVDKILDAYYDWGVRTGWLPTSDSQQQREARALERQYGPGGDWDASDAQNALGLGSIMLSAAGQHLEGSIALLRAREVIFPLAPLTRSVVEVAGRTAWILDTFKNSGCPFSIRDRAGRVCLAREDDVHRLKTVAVSLHHSTAPLRGKQLRDLRRIILPARFYPSELERDKQGKLSIRKQHLPGFRDSLGYFVRVHGVDWRAGGLYDYLSNASHPTPSAMFEVSIPVGERRRFEVEDASYPCRLVRVGAIAFLHTWALLAEYIGHPDPRNDVLLLELDSISGA